MNSAGRIEIIRAVENDLKYLKNISDVQVNVLILASNKVKIIIALQVPDNQEDKVLQIIWDNARLEVIIDKSI